MKEKAPREPQSGRKAAVAARAPGTPAGPQPADALQHSPVLSAQGKRMAQLLERGRKPLQRVKSRPTSDELKHLLAGLVSGQKGSCCDKATGVYTLLRKTVDGSDDLRGVLLTWAEDAGTGDFQMGNHTATVATWAEGTFVVDTTASQFDGGPAIFVGSLADWISLITGLQGSRAVSHVSHSLSNLPLSNSRMLSRTANLAYDVEQEFKSKKDEKSDEKTEGSDEKTVSGGTLGKSGAGGGKKCFLTSACVDFRGLPDDCHELTVLRALRDGWMRAQPQGPALIEEYEAIAPALVDAIDASPERDVFYARIFATVRGCVLNIGRGQRWQALQAYIHMVRTLQSELPTAPTAPANANAA
ncbi:MAG: hypothetical protein V4864_08300 [Pseudomonadota bacterium]